MSACVNNMPSETVKVLFYSAIDMPKLLFDGNYKGKFARFRNLLI